MTSHPAGVHPAHQVVALTPAEMVRVLPSARQTLMPLENGVEARLGLQTSPDGVGRTWNFSSLQAAKVGCHRSRANRHQMSPPSVHTEYFSANKMVLEVPSMNEVGITRLACQLAGDMVMEITIQAIPVVPKHWKLAAYPQAAWSLTI